MGMAVAFWGLALVLGLGAQILLPAAALASIIPVVFGIPYATERLFRWIVLGSTLVAVVVAVFSVFAPVLSHAPFPRETVEILVACYVPVLIGLYSFLVWQSSTRLGETLAETRRVNEALRESERSLERKVEERTAEFGPQERRAGALAAGTRRRPRRGARGEPHQERLPRQHEPRAAHAAQRDHRLQRDAARGGRGRRPCGARPRPEEGGRRRAATCSA